MKGKIIATIILLIMLFQRTDYLNMETVSASMKNGNMVTLTQKGQVIDSITYNGKTIDAIYSNETYPNNDPTYSCAAYIKKFYSTVYDIGVYNLNSPTSTPLIYDNKGAFSLTSNPQVGDIIRDNTRTHWAIVKSITGNNISVIQQSYKTGSTAWINCNIDIGDKAFSYFTYSNRLESTTDINVTDNNVTDNTATTPVITDIKYSVPMTSSIAMITNGTYNLIHVSSAGLMNAADLECNWIVESKPYDNSSNQMLSIVNQGSNQYSFQFISNQRFLSFVNNQQMITTENLDKKFVFVLRDNGLYTISPADDLNKVIARSTDLTSAVGNTDLYLEDYLGTDNEYWIMNLSSTITVPIIPQVTVNTKTLYTGYKKYSLKLNQLTEDATVTYSSSNTDIATVSTDGIINPISKGKSVIAIQVNQENNTYQYLVTVTVKDPYIKITTSDNEILSGKSIKFKAKAYGIDNAITWLVSDQTMATIDSKNGKLIAKKKGTVTIFAKVNDEITVSKKIVIK
jgi:hypothetical protein